MNNAKLLLEKITQAFPPEPGTNMRHNLTVDDDGNLVLSLMLEHGRYYPCRFENEDLLKPVNQLFKEISELMEGMT